MRLIGSAEFFQYQGFTDKAEAIPTLLQDTQQIWKIHLSHPNDPNHNCDLDYVLKKDGKRFFQEDLYIHPNGNGINPSARPEELIASIVETLRGKVKLAPNLTSEMIVIQPGIQEGEEIFHIQQGVHLVLDSPVRGARRPI